MDDITKKVLGCFVGALVLLSAVLIVVVSIVVIKQVQFEATHTCTQSHYEDNEHAAWEQFIYVNKAFIPIFHPAYTSHDFVCDKWVPKVN